MLSALVFVAGCTQGGSGQAKRKSATDRQNDAINDPFNYGPKDDAIGRDMPSVSGGGTGELNRKELQRDLDRFLNP